MRGWTAATSISSSAPATTWTSSRPLEPSAWRPGPSSPGRRYGGRPARRWCWTCGRRGPGPASTPGLTACWSAPRRAPPGSTSPAPRTGCSHQRSRPSRDDRSPACAGGWRRRWPSPARWSGCRRWPGPRGYPGPPAWSSSRCARTLKSSRSGGPCGRASAPGEAAWRSWSVYAAPARCAPPDTGAVRLGACSR